MLSVTILAVGKLKDQFYADAAAEYLKRLSAYAKVRVIEIPAVPLPDGPSEAEIENALRKEGEALLSRTPADAVCVALCVEGKALSSEETAAFFEKTALSGRSHIVFYIGGSYGLSGDVKRRAALRLSMSRMTFPHRLARVMLLEQLYRAFKILRGENYHK